MNIIAVDDENLVLEDIKDICVLPGIVLPSV